VSNPFDRKNKSSKIIKSSNHQINKSSNQIIKSNHQIKSSNQIIKSNHQIKSSNQIKSFIQMHVKITNCCLLRCMPAAAAA
jgi:hypothetical protein